MARSILSTFELNKVTPFEISKDGPYSQMTGLSESIDSDQEIGIEVEVENHAINKHPTSLWMNKGDGSLRNNGVEWITMPVAARWAPHALKDLLGESLNQDCCFSPRTSIHVHFNMQKFDTAQVIDVVLLYTALEPLFFKYTGRGRIKNIYCVPLMDTSLITGMNSSTLGHIIDGWSKYTGLNILPLRELGTIEARHMHGTFDHRKVVIWIRLWIKLMEYCRKQGTPAIRRLLLELGPNTDYQQLLNDIFGVVDAGYLKYESPKDLARSVNVVKRAFLTPTLWQTLVKQVTKTSDYFKVGA